MMQPAAFRSAAIGMVVAAALATAPRPSAQQTQAFTFHTGIDLINVTATVTDPAGRFVSGLGQGDFRVYDDGQLQNVTHFSAERVPVSLGILLDTSASMDGEKIVAARAGAEPVPASCSTIRRTRCSSTASTTSPSWSKAGRTTPGASAQSLDRLRPRGATALYDTVADAVALAQQGHNRKKARGHASPMATTPAAAPTSSRSSN